MLNYLWQKAPVYGFHCNIPTVVVLNLFVVLYPWLIKLMSNSKYPNDFNILFFFFTFQVAVLNIERTKLLFYDHAYVNNVSVTAKKYNRTNKLRFVTLKFELLVPVDRTFIVSYWYLFREKMSVLYL